MGLAILAVVAESDVRVQIHGAEGATTSP